MSVILEATPTLNVGVSFFNQLNQRDIDGALSHLDDDAAIDLEAVGIQGGGPGDLRRYLDSLFTAFPDAQFRIVRSAQFEGSVLVEVVLTGNQQAAFLGAGNQGGQLRSAGAWRFVTDSGRVTAVMGYWCQNLVYRRLGTAAGDVR